ncbi:glycoside hydrolase family 18 protein [Phaeacidiphilus oryzae]|uniref:glycoside hydrolase family 18 protein n=1 Tax=Phaeacidiphilus oryzae TaxID=348818 RepID=UPI00056B11E3|nr:cellulose binding domain-containing protein [Phaeacidiphilus oryzae]
MTPHQRTPGHRRRSRRKAVIGATVASAAVVGGTVIAVASNASAATVGASYQTTSSWDAGYSAQYTIANTSSSTLDGWTLTFTLPSGDRISSLWNGSYTVSGQTVTVKPASWNSSVPAGSSVEVGFVADGADPTAPSACTVNGTSCTAGGGSGGSGGSPSTAPSVSASAAPSAPASASPSAGTSGGATAGASASGPASAGSGSGTDAGFSPYVDTSLYPPFSLTDAQKAAGVKDFNLAFVTAGGGCTPEWGGVTALGSDSVASQIGALRSAGGDVRVSFGGANGTELGDSCSSAGTLQAAYQKVIDAYKLTKVDFDIEGAALSNTADITKRDQAIAGLQKANPGLEVSYTLPVLPTGLTQAGVDLLTDAKKQGVAVSAVNVMAMDYGDSAAPSPSGKMGQYAIDSATATQAQVKSVFGYDDATAWKHVAVTPMIGVNDTSDEVFTVSDAAQLASFAKSKGLAWLSMWSATRDKQCAGGAQSYADATCSSVTQSQWDFSKALNG